MVNRRRNHRNYTDAARPSFLKTTHLTPFYVLLGTAAGGGGGGGGGGCSVSPTSQGSMLEMLVPCLGLAVMMAILKLRDARSRNASYIAKGKN